VVIDREDAESRDNLREVPVLPSNEGAGPAHASRSVRGLMLIQDSDRDELGASDQRSRVERERAASTTGPAHHEFGYGLA
jgi:hypothetical protein